LEIQCIAYRMDCIVKYDNSVIDFELKIYFCGGYQGLRVSTFLAFPEFMKIKDSFQLKLAYIVELSKQVLLHTF
jgi:hypothetical protein